MGSIDIEKAKALALAQAQALAGQQSRAGHVEFNGSNIPGYDPATGIVSGGAIDDKTGKEYGIGVRQGIESLIGLPGDVGPLVARGANKLGLDPQTASGLGDVVSGAINPIGAMLPYNNAVSTQQIQENVTDPLLGKPDDPLTTKGQIARSSGNFAGGAFVPGGPVRKALSMALPVAGGEAAAAIAPEGYEDYARFGGQLLGGAATVPRIGGGSKVKLPTAAEIKQSAGYADLKAPMQAARVNPETYGGIVKELRAVADDFGMVPEKHGAFKTILLRHGQKAQKDGASMQDLEIMRRSLLNAGKDPLNPSAGELSRRLIDKLDESVDNVSSGNIVTAEGAAADETLGALKDARAAWRTGSKAGLIEKAMEKAKDTASGFENGLRVEFRKLLSNEKLARQFTPTEKLAMQQVVRGTTKSNMLRLLGGFGVPLDNARGFLGSVIGGGVGGSIGSAVAGPMGAMIGGPLLMGIGTAAKAGANAATRNQATVAEALVKAGPKAAEIFEQAIKSNKAGAQQALLRALLQGQLASSQVPSRQQNR